MRPAATATDAGDPRVRRRWRPTRSCAMTLDEKLGQLYGVWVGASDDADAEVAPHQHDLNDDVDLDAILPAGLASVRALRHAPVDAAVGALSLVHAGADRGANRLASRPSRTTSASRASRVGRHGVPRAAVMGRSDRPRRADGAAHRRRHALVGPPGARARARRLGDARWGRVEETIGEDPYLVATVGRRTCAGSSHPGSSRRSSTSSATRRRRPRNSRPCRPAARLRRRAAAAVRDGRARGRRPQRHELYSDLDGVPSAAASWLLTELLRDTWGFDGTVVADYFAVAFLKLLHGVADTGGCRGAASRPRRRRAAHGQGVRRAAARRCRWSGRRAHRHGAPACVKAVAEACGCSTPDWSPDLPLLEYVDPRMPRRCAHDRPRPAGEPRPGARTRRARDRARSQ